MSDALLDEQAGILNIVVNEGTDWITTLTWKDGAGNPIDLTNYTAIMQIRAKAASCSDLILELTTDPNGGIQLGGEEGTINLRIRSDQNTFGKNIYHYDLKLIDISSSPITLIRGTIKSIPAVTK